MIKAVQTDTDPLPRTQLLRKNEVVTDIRSRRSVKLGIMNAAKSGTISTVSQPYSAVRRGCLELMVRKRVKP